MCNATTFSNFMETVVDQFSQLTVHFEEIRVQGKGPIRLVPVYKMQIWTLLECKNQTRGKCFCFTLWRLILFISLS